MTATQRATLAAVEHYDHRARQLAAALRAAPWSAQPADRRALELIARARRAELIDPDPLPHIRRSADA